VEVGSGVIVDAPAELRDRFLLLFIPCVAQPLQEQERENEVSKVRGVNWSAKNVRCFPQP
jgi:hypothetical protein